MSLPNEERQRWVDVECELEVPMEKGGGVHKADAPQAISLEGSDAVETGGRGQTIELPEVAEASIFLHREYADGASTSVEGYRNRPSALTAMSILVLPAGFEPTMVFPTGVRESLAPIAKPDWFEDPRERPRVFR